MNFDQLVTLCGDTHRKFSETPSRISEQPHFLSLKKSPISFNNTKSY